MLNKFKLTDILFTFYDVFQIKIIFNFNVNSIMNVSNLEKNIDKINKIIIINNKSCFFKKKIKHMLIKIKKYKKKDKIKITYIDVKNNLKFYIYFFKNTFSDFKINKKLKTDNKKKLIVKIEKIVQ